MGYAKFERFVNPLYPHPLAYCFHKLRGDIQTIVGKINVIMTLGRRRRFGALTLTAESKLWITAYEW